MKSRLIDHIKQPELLSSDTYIKTEYSRYASNQVSNILKNGIDDQAVVRKEVEAITIDGATSLDLDDAIWAEKTKHGYCVWVHISDVSETIPMFSPLDLEALERTTSIYRRDHILDMLPPELSNGSLSLDPYGWKKLTMTLQVDINDQWDVLKSQFYESRFTNLKRYDYEQFWQDFVNPDSDYYTTLHTLKEVSDRLRSKRLLSWWILNFSDEGRKQSIWENNKVNQEIFATKKISHDIIESLMVFANVNTGNFLNRREWIPSLYKRHDSLDERSYYHHVWDSYHTGLAVYNYAHFTSPIRRYADMVIHRLVKSILRWEECPYTLDDIRFVAKHINNTRWKVETLGAQIDMDVKWQDFINRTLKRLWRPLEVYDMKPYIRNSTHKSLKLPAVMTESIAEKMQKWNLGDWVCFSGMILLWKEKSLKEVIRRRIVDEKSMWPKEFLSVLSQTKILLRDEPIFEVKEIEGDNKIRIIITAKWKTVAIAESEIKENQYIKDIKYLMRKKVIVELFDYYIQNEQETSI